VIRSPLASRTAGANMRRSSAAERNDPSSRETDPMRMRFVARGDSDDQVVGMIRGHIAADHPTLLETVSREDLVSWIQAD
jgi:hypothetical protein